MTKIIDLSGKGAAIDGTENDANLSSLSGINSPITATTHTIDVDDQNDTIEYSNASPIAVTLPTISSVSGSSIHTDDFKVTLKNIGAGLVTVTRGGIDTFDDGSTSIALEQYEYVTIQTDSTLAKWNIINSFDADFATKTGTETLTDKTLTSPVINTGVSGDAGVSRLLQSSKTVTTSGSTVNITGIPSWAKKLTISLDSVSWTGDAASEYIGLRLGDSVGIESTGYKASMVNVGASIAKYSTTEFPIIDMFLAAATVDGLITIILHDSTTNLWILSGGASEHQSKNSTVNGSKALSATLDRVQLLCSDTATFDAGSFRVTYEG